MELETASALARLVRQTQPETKNEAPIGQRFNQLGERLKKFPTLQSSEVRDLQSGNKQEVSTMIRFSGRYSNLSVKLSATYIKLSENSPETVARSIRADWFDDEIAYAKEVLSREELYTTINVKQNISDLEKSVTEAEEEVQKRRRRRTVIG